MAIDAQSPSKVWPCTGSRSNGSTSNSFEDGALANACSWVFGRTHLIPHDFSKLIKWLVELERLGWFSPNSSVLQCSNCHLLVRTQVFLSNTQEPKLWQKISVIFFKAPGLQGEKTLNFRNLLQSRTGCTRILHFRGSLQKCKLAV